MVSAAFKAKAKTIQIVLAAKAWPQGLHHCEYDILVVKFCLSLESCLTEIITDKDKRGKSLCVLCGGRSR